MDITQVQSWNDLRIADAVDPSLYIKNAILSGAGFSDQGVRVHSTSYSTPPSSQALLKIIAVRVRTTSGGLHSLALMSNPIMMQMASAFDLPDTIEVDFNYSPDPGTVTIASFTVITTGGAIPGTVVTMVSSTTARLTLPGALAAGVYQVQINGSTAPVVTLLGIPLDGEAFGLPSGQGLAGGDFVFGLIVQPFALPAPGLIPPLPLPTDWRPSPISFAGTPFCVALGTDDKLAMADAAQWNVSHSTSAFLPSVAPNLLPLFFVRAGKQWQMNFPMNLGVVGILDLQLSLLLNASTPGNWYSRVPVVSFAARTYRDAASLGLTFEQPCYLRLGLRAIDSQGLWSMFEMDVLCHS